MADRGRKRVETLIREISETLSLAEELAQTPEGEFARSRRDRYALRMALVELAESCSRLGLEALRLRGVHSVSAYREIFKKMVELGMISPEVSEEMQRLIGLRNLIIHRYWEVDDLRVLREARLGGLDVVRRFLEEVRRNVLGS